MPEAVRYEVKDRLAILTLDHPPMNTLSRDMVRQFGEIVTELSRNSRVGAVIVTGTGEKSFCAGAEISEIPELGKEQGRSMAASGEHTLKRLSELPCVVIAAVNGYALGGGCELAMACDIRVASENALLGLPEVKLGLLPGYGGTQHACPG